MLYPHDVSIKVIGKPQEYPSTELEKLQNLQKMAMLTTNYLFLNSYLMSSLNLESLIPGI